MFMQGRTSPPVTLTQPWRLPAQGLAVFHGECDAPRLSHYFLPRLALEGKRILFLDGANSANPRLMARLAERRGLPFAQISRQIKIARAFTCFQLTELIRRVPQFLADFPAEVLIVTAFPELYFDEDVRDADAQAAFRQALGHLRRYALGGSGELGAGERTKLEIRNSKFEIRNSLHPGGVPGKLASEIPNSEFRNPRFDPELKPDACDRDNEFRVSNFEFRVSPLPRSVALFSTVSGFQPPPGRKLFFAQTCAVATELWKFQVDEHERLGLMRQDQVLGLGTGG